MLHVVFRFLGYWLTAVALVAVVVDGAKSIAASRVVTTSLSEAWRVLGSPDAAPVQAVIPPTASADWMHRGLDAALPWLLATPVSAVVGGMGLLFLVAGRKRRRYSLSREFAA